MALKIFINEHIRAIPEHLTLGKLRDETDPKADVLLVNGAPCSENYILKDKDRVVFIKKGVMPKKEDSEFLMMARHTPGVHSRMKSSVVGVAGLGGLGSSVSIALARMGVGRLIIADRDVVEPSNLNRQQFFFDQIGWAKTEAMKKTLIEINPFIEIEAHSITLERVNIPQIFKSANIVIECFDSAAEKKQLIETVAESLPDTYVIGASGLAGYGDSNSIQTYRIGDKIFLVGDLKKAAGPGQGLMAPRVGIASHHQANLAVSLLVDPEEAVSQISDIAEITFL